MKKYILPVIAFGALMFGIVSMVKSQPKSEATAPPSPPPVSPYIHTVAADGLVESSSENISIGTPIADVVSEIPVVVGQRVKAGDVLFKLDVRQLQADLAVRNAELEVAQTEVKVDEASYDDVKQQLDFADSLSDKRAISSEELSKRSHAVDVAGARLEESRAEVSAEAAEVESVQMQIDRSIIRAPIDGEVLQCKVHIGEFAPAGVTDTPLILLGRLKPLNIRVDVDENEAWRVRPDARAVATVRGNANLKTELSFVRFEPFVLPKKSLTGDNTERVDTRVLQVVYRVDDDKLPLFVGQQMDVFIEAPAPDEQAAR